MGNWLGLIEDPLDNPVDGNAIGVAGVGGNSDRPAIESMAAHVKEVLPQVPIDVIRKDLTVTTNVDETITRLLDGTVVYVPEAQPSSCQASDTVKTSPSPATSSSATSLQSCANSISYPPLITAASSFGKNASERNKSFEERKAKLIEESRQRYLSKQELVKQTCTGVTQ